MGCGSAKTLQHNPVSSTTHHDQAVAGPSWAGQRASRICPSKHNMEPRIYGTPSYKGSPSDSGVVGSIGCIPTRSQAGQAKKTDTSSRDNPYHEVRLQNNKIRPSSSSYECTSAKQYPDENFRVRTSVNATSRIRVTLSSDGSMLEVETEKLSGVGSHDGSICKTFDDYSGATSNDDYVYLSQQPGVSGLHESYREMEADCQRYSCSSLSSNDSLQNRITSAPIPSEVTNNLYQTKQQQKRTKRSTIKVLTQNRDDSSISSNDVQSRCKQHKHRDNLNTVGEYVQGNIQSSESLGLQRFGKPSDGDKIERFVYYSTLSVDKNREKVLFQNTESTSEPFEFHEVQNHIRRTCESDERTESSGTKCKEMSKKGMDSYMRPVSKSGCNCCANNEVFPSQLESEFPRESSGESQESNISTNEQLEDAHSEAKHVSKKKQSKFWHRTSRSVDQSDVCSDPGYSRPHMHPGSKNPDVQQAQCVSLDGAYPDGGESPVSSMNNRKNGKLFLGCISGETATDNNNMVTNKSRANCSRNHNNWEQLNHELYSNGNNTSPIPVCHMNYDRSYSSESSDRSGHSRSSFALLRSKVNKAMPPTPTVQMIVASSEEYYANGGIPGNVDDSELSRYDSGRFTPTEDIVVVQETVDSDIQKAVTEAFVHQEFCNGNA